MLSGLPVGCTAQQLIRTSTRHHAAMVLNDEKGGDADDDDDHDGEGDDETVSWRRL